jgi:ssDNA-binding Zn-finger/Zn-ribbon topoisomerase 1
MASVVVRCPQCGSNEVIKRGNTGGQRYRCRNNVCAQGSFLLEYRYQGYLPRVKRQIVDMALNGSGIRDTARVLGISKDTVVSEPKKQTEIEPLNRPFLDRLADPARPIILAQEAEADEILWAGRPRHAGCGKPWTIEPGLSSPRAAVHKRKQHNRSGFGPRGGQL